jgi:hypothetical protein
MCSTVTKLRAQLDEHRRKSAIGILLDKNARSKSEIWLLIALATGTVVMDGQPEALTKAEVVEAEAELKPLSRHALRGR